MNWWFFVCMTDIPDNVDLNWIPRHLVEMRGEFGGLRVDVRTLRDDFGVVAAPAH
jgi:hypothetical protein